MVTVAEIAKEAFDAVADEMPDVVQVASLTRTVPMTWVLESGYWRDDGYWMTRTDAYDPVTGEYETVDATFSCRALFADEKAIADTFPSYVVGPSDRMVYAEGLAVVPEENDRMAIGGQPVVVTRVGDIVGVGTFFSLIVRNA